MSQPPFQIHPDDHLAARITAYALGEASPFEAAEIESLVAKSPELKILLDRTRALHCLLQEAEALPAPTDENWKLPPGKKIKLTRALGDTPQIPRTVSTGRSNHRFRKIAAFAIAACALFSAFLLTLTRPEILEKALARNDFNSPPDSVSASASPEFRERQINELKKSIREQEDKVEEARKVLTTISRTKDIAYYGEPRFLDGRTQSDVNNGTSASLVEADRLEGEKIQLETQIESLLKYDSEQLLIYASGLDLPDNIIKTVYPQYLELKRQVDGLKASGLAERHPTLQTNQRVLASMKDQLDEGVVNLRTRLQGQLESSKERLAKVEMMRDGNKMENLERSIDTTDYIDAKRDFDADQALLEQMKLELLQKETGDNSLAENESAATPMQLAASPSGEAVSANESPAIGNRALPSTKRKAEPLADAFSDAEPSDLAMEQTGDFEEEESAKKWSEGSSVEVGQAALPTADLADLSQEIPAAQDPFSTFSLNISDASFQLAAAAIARGERPDPASIKPEQFYNAIDYGDPAPSSREPVAAAIDQTGHPVIPGRNLVRIAARTASTGRSAAQPLRLTLLIDQSGSMVRKDRRDAMETALTQLAKLLTAQDEVTVIGFSRTPRLLADSLSGNQADKLPDIINQSSSEGGTNLEQAINLASELALRHKLAGAQNRIVLFTDGAANLGNADPRRLSGKIETLRQQGLSFDIAGIGTDDLNDTLLAELARHGNGRYYLAGEDTASSVATQLAGAFRPAAENVKIQVKLNPGRVGTYKLIGFEKDRLMTEDFRNDSIDAAELAADEAGVAMYQVETLPEGSGEIGEVSIRFRETASGEMVERT